MSTAEIQYNQPSVAHAKRVCPEDLFGHSALVYEFSVQDNQPLVANGLRNIPPTVDSDSSSGSYAKSTTDLSPADLDASGRTNIFATRIDKPATAPLTQVPNDSRARPPPTRLTEKANPMPETQPDPPNGSAESLTLRSNPNHSPTRCMLV